jgi:predicted acetyltransferase
MSPADLLIAKIGPESSVVLRDLFKHYLHDMAEWFEVDTKTDGSYSYDTSEVWDKGYQAYLGRVGDLPAGFALVGSAEQWIGEAGVHDMDEFFILRRFRRHGFGHKLATFLWDEHPGEWLVRVLEANAPALSFWRTSIASYSNGLYEEDGRISKGRSWRYFRFASPTRSAQVS